MPFKLRINFFLFPPAVASTDHVRVVTRTTFTWIKHKDFYTRAEEQTLMTPILIFANRFEKQTLKKGRLFSPTGL